MTSETILCRHTPEVDNESVGRYQTASQKDFQVSQPRRLNENLMEVDL
eukprot:CAMPEP_0118673242 /NCGR_PEP_ID=MMETSP0800-20121206/211_1 /TAXON_ID=210618 ORGANISM="Striatella unipunctata, Strain CCMP2910" /NCGR_SAMPLE_ID=MMETSP0800 /ASSEMBLY_ACC=CAM_ASM_000638 /LENGTH=47 /DNA_ID= /DNA_START= /DNA_END= /DNA_ORIENTATION=